MISVISNIKDFENLRDDWNEIYNSSKDYTIFQSFNYNYISWNSLLKDNPSNKLYILAYYQCEGYDKCDAIFPFYIDKKKQLHIINDIHSDICNCIISSKIENSFDIIWELYTYIENDKNIKSIFFDNIKHNSPLISYYKVFCSNAFLFSQTEYSYIEREISNDPIQDLSYLKAKNRKNIKCRYNESSKFTYKLFLKQDEKEFPLNEINHLVDEMTKTGIRSKDYLSEKMIKYWEHLYNKNLLEIPILYDENNNPLSAGLIFSNTQKNEYIRWIVLYKESKHNLFNVIRHWVERNKQSYTIVNFGRGGYEYKMTLFKPNVEPLFRLMYSKTLWGNLYIFFKINISHLRKTLNTLRK